jgi:hypothetical protein
MLSVGPADSLAIVGVGGVVRANQPAQVGQGVASFNYVYGWSVWGFRPQFAALVTARGDGLAGLGVMNEYVFKTVSIAPDGRAPVFFSWGVSPSLYEPGPKPNGNAGGHFQFHMTDEIGFYAGKSMRVSLVYEHYSSGDFTLPNPNGNAFGVKLGYRF